MVHCPYLRDWEHAGELFEPEQGRRCLAQHPPTSPSLSTQERLCLHDSHAECPHYQLADRVQANAGSETAGAYAGPRSSFRGPGVSRRRRQALLFVMVVVVVAAGYLLAGGAGPGTYSGQYQLQPLQTAVPSGTSTCTLTPAATGTPVLPTATPTATPRPKAFDAPTRIRIPRIGVDAEVVEVAYSIREENGKKVTVWQVADFAVGFHVGSAYPGHAGNTVLAAHNNIRGRIFRHLVDLVPGDDIYLYVGDLEFHYQVTESMLVLEKGVPEEIQRENAQWIQPTTDERLTLVSCWPFVRPDHRVVVVAYPYDQQ